MERRKAVIAAAAATATLLAGAAAISLNTSLVGASGDDGVGQISPVEPETSPATVFVDEPAARTVLPGGDGSDDGSDDEYDHDGYDDEFDGQESHDGDDDHEYEGADDDD